MINDFYIDGIGSGEFNARLLAEYEVGGTGITRTRQKSQSVQGWIPLDTKYSLRKITLPLHVFAGSARQAAEYVSRLTAAFSVDPIELYLPNDMTYTASLDDVGAVTECTEDGREVELTYEFVGYAHDPLETITGGRLYIRGTAPEMLCRIFCKVSASSGTYTMAGVTWNDVSAGDVLVLDGLKKQVLRNGANDFGRTNLITWPTLKPGENVISAPDALTVEYYPIWI